MNMTAFRTQLIKTAITYVFDAISKSNKASVRKIVTEMEQSAPIPQALPITTTVAPTVSNTELVQHQRREIIKEMLLLEAHLTQGCKIHGKACDCCEKHPIKLEGLAQETVGITGKTVYNEVADFARSVAPMTTAAASATGEYDAEYPKLATQLRELRKKVMTEV